MDSLGTIAASSAEMLAHQPCHQEPRRLLMQLVSICVRGAATNRPSKTSQVAIVRESVVMLPRLELWRWGHQHQQHRQSQQAFLDVLSMVVHMLQTATTAAARRSAERHARRSSKCQQASGDTRRRMITSSTNGSRRLGAHLWYFLQTLTRSGNSICRVNNNHGKPDRSRSRCSEGSLDCMPGLEKEIHSDGSMEQGRHAISTEHHAATQDVAAAESLLRRSSCSRRPSHHQAQQCLVTVCTSHRSRTLPRAMVWQILQLHLLRT
mmetsp:Transcript_44979/g.104063  ORF Transcript_44979/g.104063 Transcript_44979/m.104063 type:complete len:265 (+) Transcript_44979:897-1691(+)